MASLETETGSGVQEQNTGSWWDDVVTWADTLFTGAAITASSAVDNAREGARSDLAAAAAASGAPLSSVRDTAQWTSIAVIAIAVVILVLIAVFMFFYFRGFR